MKYCVNNQKIFCDITDGIAILIEIDTGVYYGLNALTSNVFENITSGNDTNDILTELAKVNGYNDEIKNKFEAFVSTLVEKEFIKETDNQTNSLNVNIECFTNDEDDFTLSEYRDVADLLLADPIHEVKEDKGWKPDLDSLK